MLCRTKGFVVSHVKYNDNNIIAKVYTQSEGMLSLMLRHVHSTKSANKSNFFQPLSLIDVVFEKKANREIFYIKELSFAETYKTIPFEVEKSAVAMLMAEVIAKSIKECERNYSVFDFIYQSAKMLDNATNSDYINTFPLIFLIQFTKYLGFYPKSKSSENTLYFCLEDGVFVQEMLNEKRILNEDISAALNNLLQYCNSLNDDASIPFVIKEKFKLMEVIADYYGIHLGGNFCLKNLALLQMISA